MIVFRRLWGDDAQTKRRYHHPGCAGDGDALGWDVRPPQAERFAKAARHHGRTKKTKIIIARGDDTNWYDFYVGIDHAQK